tara:strand:+ start:246 stop:434 length:189 start_codon:yes stop_codon:yes gene_type:complete
MKHPKQGFVKEVKEKHTDLIKSLESEGWYKCAGKKDVSLYKEPVKKKAKKKKSVKKEESTDK